MYVHIYIYIYRYIYKYIHIYIYIYICWLAHPRTSHQHISHTFSHSFFLTHTPYTPAPYSPTNIRIQTHTLLVYVYIFINISIYTNICWVTHPHTSRLHISHALSCSFFLLHTPYTTPSYWPTDTHIQTHTLQVYVHIYIYIYSFTYIWQIPLKMLQPQNPPNPATQIPRYKFSCSYYYSDSLNQNLNLDLYREIPRNLSFSIW